MADRAGQRVQSASIDDRERLVVDGDGEALFPWWSFTKTVIAILAVQAWEAGRLELDKAMPGRPYTASQLLQHRAGVPNYGALAAYHEAVARREPAWPRDAMLRHVRPERLVFEPGTGFSYSNVGYLFLKEHLESLSGRDLGSLIREGIVTPLGLRSVRLATTKGDLATLFTPGLADYDPGWVYHGCLLGTAADAASIMHALATGRLVRPASVMMMRERHSPGGALAGRPWLAIGYGLGLMTGQMAEVGQSFGHSGVGPGSSCAVYHFPQTTGRLTVAAFADSEDESIPEFETAHQASTPHRD